MIYNLTHEFTMLAQTEGLMQNMTLHTPIELVTSENNPQKDSGITLMPLEKMRFATCGNERIFARCTKLDGTIATLSVANIHDPVKSACNIELQNITLAPKMEKFEEAGTYEWTVPKSAWYEVTITGAGGAGGSAMITRIPASGRISIVGGAGGAGGTAQKNIYLLKGTVIPIKVGAGGKNTKYIPGEEEITTEPGGEESYFGTHCSATGGSGGQTQPRPSSVARKTGNGGNGINGDINILGGRAIAACIYKTGSNELQFFSPGCSPSIYGGKGAVKYTSSHGANGVYGAGGEGAVAQTYNELKPNFIDPDMVNVPFYGGDGGDGVVIIRWFEFEQTK